MFTLQVLDRGQTFLFPLDDRPIHVGSGPSCELRLQESGIADRHARFERSGDQLRLQALAGELRLNGRPVRDADLALGDRIEIGAAVLVVGRSVARTASADDVVGETRAAARIRAERPARRSSRWLPFVGAAVVAGAAVAFAIFGGGDDGNHNFSGIDRLRRAGSFAAARAEVTRLRTDWAAGDENRLRKLDALDDRITVTEGAVEERRQAVIAAVDQDYAQISRQLQREEKQAGIVGEAARIVRSSLTEILAGRPGAPVVPIVPTVEQPTSPEGAKPTTATVAQAQTAVADNTVDAVAVQSQLDDAMRLQQQGLFLQALDALQAALANGDASVQQRVQTQIEATRKAALTARDELLATTRGMVEKGELAAAADLLGKQAHRFPVHVDFAVLGSTHRDLQERAVAKERQARIAAARPAPAAPAKAVDEGQRRVTLASLQALLDRIRTAELAGDAATAATLLREGADLVRERDPDYAGRLVVRADECERIGGLHAAIAKFLQGGGKIELPLRSGRLGLLHGVDGAALLADTTDGPQRLTLLDLTADGLGTLLVTAKLGGDAALGAATMLYRNGEPAAAETVLAKAVKAEPALKPRIDAAIAAGRGEPADPRGYTLRDGLFVAAKQIDAEKASVRLLAQLQTVLRGRDHKARDAFVTDLLAQGPDALGAVVLAFRKELAGQIERIGKSNLKKQVDKLAVQRAALDDARKHAIELIYDEVKYFYPYKPPAVSAEKAKEYAEVQAEVDRRVASVRAIWNDDRLRIKVPATLQDDLSRLDWVARTLAELGELDASAMAEVEWARALPPGDAIDITTYCVTSLEREQLVEWQKVEAYNAIVVRKVAAGEKEQLAVTNAYRAMFRHRPLALNLKIVTAARGHAEEMSTLGYFAHFSPTPGRRTPFDRMKLAGYDFGVSENIALNDGAEASHNAWCHSSGHHRNLLSPTHREFGVGNLGRYWVQNFGGAQQYLETPEWAEALEKGQSR
ncbi:MAG: hypothetical protein IPK26_27920 [Planctomycetes bacterium]|nr:hypothetical protein [Planctomycetota bacterium]